MTAMLGLIGALGLMLQHSDLVGGFAVGVVDDKGDTAIEVEGIAAPEHQVQVSQDTVFHIASLSKQITAAALALAILDGKVELDDPVLAHVPEASHYGPDLTVGHLVYFTSGLTEGYDIPRSGDTPWSTHFHFTVAEAIEASLSAPSLQFEPGSEWRYNNINYQLIAEIVERAYEQRFSSFVRERIFSPLGMNASLVHDDITAIVHNRANGVVPRTEPFVSALEQTGLELAGGSSPILIRRNAPHYGGSGVLTTMSDWLKWQEALLTKSVFPDAFWSLMVRQQTFEHPKDNDAFGLVHGEFEGQPALWFSGGDIDASSHMIALPEQGLSATCFSNQPGFDCRARVHEALREKLRD